MALSKEEVLDLIKDAGFGYLATVEGGQPRVRPMMPLLTDEGELLIALLKRSRTIQQIQDNPQVEICFVDRKMWYCRVTGKGSIVENIEKKTLLWNNIPMLKQYFSGPEDEGFILLEIKIQGLEAMTPHQKEPEEINL
ncbi:hypothetical protein MNBD_UNCLBAC01-1091 [hydrothermal vent metagenome]|uniref:Pyridoxamine 5'-phosphate oxidase N-terminal domain-containing protein n=1 Tax=hydrothermal vent metagenome TaxID=652676 RepID=A0A3B1CY87_9ZZZZ